MKDNYDFSNAVKNPYADKMKNGYTVTIYYKPVKNKISKSKKQRTTKGDNS